MDSNHAQLVQELKVARLDAYEEGQYTASGNEAMCAGAMIYLEKLGRPTVGMRLGRLWGRYQPRAMLAHHDLIMEPDKSAFQPSRKTQVKVRKHDAKTV
jgi:hypothetical protein